MSSKKALLLIDLQNDFCEGGSLAVPEGDAVIPIANRLQSQFEFVVATKDWHPADHASFASNHPGQAVGKVISLNGLPQVLWPDHCVQGSHGADFHPALQTDSLHAIILKGTDKAIDSYSAFFDNAHLRATDLADVLRQAKVTDLYIMGLATDYCVKFSCLDAVSLGFRVFLIEDGCRGVNLQPEGVASAIAEMKASGVKVILSGSLKNK